MFWVGIGFFVLAGFCLLQILLRLLSIRQELSCPVIAHKSKAPPKYLVRLWYEKEGKTWNDFVVKEGNNSREALFNVAEMLGLEDVRLVIHDWESPARYSCGSGFSKKEGVRISMESTLVDETEEK